MEGGGGGGEDRGEDEGGEDTEGGGGRRQPRQRPINHRRQQFFWEGQGQNNEVSGERQGVSVACLHPPSPLPPTPYLCAPPRFRALLMAPDNARGFPTGSDPPRGSALTGPPPASMAGRRCGPCTGDRTHNMCTGARRSDSHRLVWTGQASIRLSAGCSCSTDQPGNGPVQPTYM